MRMGLSLGLSRGSTVLGETDPLAVSASALHRWRADNKTLNGASVSDLSDMIGALDQTQASALAQPTFNAADASYGGKPTISGTGWFFDHTTTVTAIAAPVSIAVVGYIQGGIRAWFSGSSSAPYNLLWTYATGELEFYTGVSLTSAAGTISAPSLVVLVDTGSATSLYVNDMATPVATVAASRWSSMTSLDIGKGAAGVADAAGSWAEMIVYGGALSAGDRAIVREYVSQRYGI